MTKESTEQMISDRASSAPRVTPADIQAAIRETHFFTAADGVFGASITDGLDDGSTPPLNLLTFCVLVLHNGFTVTGESACASPENFDAEIGRRVARENAENKIWPLLGFRLKDQLHAGGVGFDAHDVASAESSGFRKGYASCERGDAPPLPA